MRAHSPSTKARAQFAGADLCFGSPIINFLSLDTVTGRVMFPAIFYATLTQVTVLGTLVVDGVAKIIYQNQQFRWIRF